MNTSRLRTARAATTVPLALLIAVWPSFLVAQTTPAAAPASQPATSTGPATGSNTPSTAGDPVVELSPFTVDASGDRGYFAENTLAGSRLNTNVSDLAASITVVTKQQLSDTASIDINDVFLYEANTEGTGNYTDFNIDTRGAVQDRVAGFQGGAPSLPFTPSTANRIRGIPSAVDKMRDYYPGNARLPFDVYNTDSIEINRGPNSLLFGLGNPAGIVNQSVARANLRREITTFEGRYGSNDAIRASFNINRPIIQDKLGLYLAGVHDERGFARQPAYDITQRGYAALGYKPFEKTTIRANIEYYKNKNRRPNSVTPRDFVSPWIAAGRPSYNPITGILSRDGVEFGPFAGNVGAHEQSIQVNSLGTVQFDGNRRPVLMIEQGEELLYIMRQLSSTPNTAGVQAAFTYNSPIRATKSQGPNLLLNQITGRPAGLTFAQPGVTDQSIYDWESINILSGNFGEDQATVYNVELEQQILPNLHLQLGWYREDFKSKVHYYISQQTGVTLYVDTNIVQVDGTPNPQFGRPFIEITQPDYFEHPEDNMTGRATLAYDLDFTKRGDGLSWLGRHRFMGLWQEQHIDRDQLRFRPIIQGNTQLWNPIPMPGNPPAPNIWQGDTTQNALERRFYVGDSSGRVTMDPGLYPNATRSHPLRWFNPTTQQWVNENVTATQELHFVSSRSQQEIESRALALQSFLFQDRLVGTAGIRRDVSRSRTSGTGARTAAGLSTQESLAENFGAWSEAEGDTTTYGGVVRPFKGWRAIDSAAERGSWAADAIRSLSFHYNKSDNFTPQGRATDFRGNDLPFPTGEGQDYGFGFALFGNKLVGRVNWFEQSAEKARGGLIGQAISRTLSVDDQQFRTWAQWVTGSATNNSAAVNAILQLPANMAAADPGGFFGPLVAANATTTVQAEGLEIQMTYNPSNNWTIKFNAAKQETIYSNIGPEWDEWVAERMPLWTSASAPGFPNFWQTTGADLTAAGFTGFGPGAQQTVADWWFTNVGAIVSTSKRLEGKVTQDQRKWRWNALTNYTFTDGPFKNLGVGGGLRWQDRAAIGYLASAPDADGIIRSLDVDKPVWGGEEFAVDAWLSYTINGLPWIGDRVRTKLQLNVRDLLENGGLDPIAVNPDGQRIAFRIVEPRQWYFTATFDF